VSPRLGVSSSDRLEDPVAPAAVTIDGEVTVEARDPPDAEPLNHSKLVRSTIEKS
jgi:hypothetical protein